MSGSEIYYPKIIGTIVKQERDKREMSQMDFYSFLFPTLDCSEKTVKSKMNDIENGRRKNIDPEFLKALHDKCNVSMDYIFGYETEYPNHENKNASQYTSLSIETIEILHSLALAKSAEIPSSYPGMSDEEFHQNCVLKSDKQTAEWILKIIEVLLTEDIEKHEDTLPNYNILFDLYMIGVMSLEQLKGIRLENIKENDSFWDLADKYEELSPDYLFMKDTFGFGQMINLDEVHKQIWKNRLNEHIDNFSIVMKKYLSRNSQS